MAAIRRIAPVRSPHHHVDPAIDFRLFHNGDVVANFQPLWVTAASYDKELTLPFVGPERGRWLDPIGRLFRSGAVVALGSDWDAFIPEERIELHDAITAFTINAAYVKHSEDRTGSIEVGKLADRIVIDRNLFAIEPAEISEPRVTLTPVGGEAVRGDLLSTFAQRSADRRQVEPQPRIRARFAIPAHIARCGSPGGGGAIE